MNSDMKKMLDNTWDQFRELCLKVQERDQRIVFDEEKKDEFIKVYEEYYNYIMETFMRNTLVLDPHKQAAILTISALQCHIVRYEEEENEETICILPQIIAISVAMDYMLYSLNKLLKRAHLTQEIEKYRLPIATACDTPYLEIMARMLYYEQYYKDMQFNILELADRYFLIEYLTLLNEGIEPEVIKHVSNK